MISSKYLSKITAIVMAIIVLLCCVAVAYHNEISAAFSETSFSTGYESKLFDTDNIISVNIIMDKTKWDEMLSNAMSEAYYQCDVVINGTTFSGAGIRPKGNTSLSSIASDPDNNRYSFKLEFDQFAEGQSCWGLDKLVLNNNYADKTAMKEAVIYDMYKYLGADAPLYNYAQISVNGEYWGVYLALEAIEDSFMLRNYGTEKGYLYKPDGMNMGIRQDGANGERPQMPEGGMPGFGEGGMPGFGEGGMPDFGEGGMPDFGAENRNGDGTALNRGNAESEAGGDENPFERGARGGRMGGGPGGMGGGNGANLNYTDDSLESYQTIWDGAISDSADADHRRVVAALKNIHEGTDLENYLDVENVLKYMAVHSFAVNQDSLSGNMAHNYYLYESGGKLNILPWDYNLAFGGMGGMGRMGASGNGAQSMINDPIDTPFAATEFFDSLLENEEYLRKYHEYYSQLIEEYVFGGRFDETYNHIKSQINELVKLDPNAMYTYEEFVAGSEMLYDTVMLRGESIRGQLSGEIPSTDEEQQQDSSSLIDASSIDTTVMGEFMGGGPGGGRGENGNRQQNTEGR